LKFKKLAPPMPHMLFLAKIHNSPQITPKKNREKPLPCAHPCGENIKPIQKPKNLN